jgi:hypothetical protein
MVRVHYRPEVNACEGWSYMLRPFLFANIAFSIQAPSPTPNRLSALRKLPLAPLDRSKPSVTGIQRTSQSGGEQMNSSVQVRDAVRLRRFLWLCKSMSRILAKGDSAERGLNE